MIKFLEWRLNKLKTECNSFIVILLKYKFILIILIIKCGKFG